MLESGTGFLVDMNGLVMTCSHCVPKWFSSLSCYLATNPTKPVDADFVARDDNHDVALVRLRNPSPLNFATFGHFVDFGMEIYSIGHPDSLRLTFAVGHIAYPRRKGWELGTIFEGMDADTDLVHIANLHMEGGASGSPIFDAHGGQSNVL